MNERSCPSAASSRTFPGARKRPDARRRCCRSTSTCARTTSSPSSAPRAAASRRCCASWPGSTSRATGRCCSTASRIEARAPTAAWCSRATRCFPGSRWRRTSASACASAACREAQQKERSDYFIAKVGLRGFEHHFPKQLSGGMQQRTAIARALANDPKMLLLDEPFGALDNQTRVLMQELLLGIWESARKTVLFVTHDIDEAIFMANRVAVFSARPGRIKAEIAVDFPHPRHYTIKTSPEFMEIKARLTEEIRAESMAAERAFERCESLRQPLCRRTSGARGPVRDVRKDSRAGRRRQAACAGALRAGQGLHHAQDPGRLLAGRPPPAVGARAGGAVRHLAHDGQPRAARAGRAGPHRARGRRRQLRRREQAAVDAAADRQHRQRDPRARPRLPLRAARGRARRGLGRRGGLARPARRRIGVPQPCACTSRTACRCSSKTATSTRAWCPISSSRTSLARRPANTWCATCPSTRSSTWSTPCCPRPSRPAPRHAAGRALPAAHAPHLDAQRAGHAGALPAPRLALPPGQPLPRRRQPELRLSQRPAVTSSRTHPLV